MSKLNKKGISLIVLVITIIVMIILAAAIILSLSSNGIIERANEAKIKSNEANLKQAVTIAKSEWEMMTSEQKEGLKYTDHIEDKLETVLGSEAKSWVEENVIKGTLSDLGYIFTEINGKKYMTGLDSEAKKSVESLISNNYTVQDNNGRNITSGKITTGYKILMDGVEVATVVYYGDVNADGEIDKTDSDIILDYCIELVILENEYFYASDVDKSGRCNEIDSTLINDFIRGIGSGINQNTPITVLK